MFKPLTLPEVSKEELLNATKLLLGRLKERPWPEVPDDEVFGLVGFLRDTGQRRMPMTL